MKIVVFFSVAIGTPSPYRVVAAHPKISNARRAVPSRRGGLRGVPDRLPQEFGDGRGILSEHVPTATAVDDDVNTVAVRHDEIHFI